MGDIKQCFKYCMWRGQTLITEMGWPGSVPPPPYLFLKRVNIKV